jgi:LPS-assembly lipoprotein
MQRRLASYTLILGMSCLLAACGFQLRGTGSGGAALPDAWKNMYLATGNPNSEFSQTVRNVFAANDIVWADRGEADYILVLGPEKFTQTNLSLNKEARVSQYELTMQAAFSVRGSDRAEVMPEAVASVTRQMENDPRNAMGKGEEIRNLKSEMREELAQQIIRRIGFFATSSP